MNDGKYRVAKFDLAEYEYHVEGDYVVIDHRFNAKTWADSILRKYALDYYFNNLGAGVVIARRQRVHNGCPPKLGTAICNPKDKFCLNIGKAIAICRAEGIKIPDEIFQK